MHIADIRTSGDSPDSVQLVFSDGTLYDYRGEVLYSSLLGWHVRIGALLLALKREGLAHFIALLPDGEELEP